MLRYLSESLARFGRPPNILQTLFWLTAFYVAAAGCGDGKPREKSVTAGNQALLKELNDGQLWFHAKKTRPIWVRRLEKPETVKTLEGEERVPSGNYLCRGEAGDIWPQTEDRLTAKYSLTDDLDDQGWRKCLPKPDASGVMAAQVSHAFHVQAQWGVLSGKAGDFVVKNYEDRDNPDPKDVWIVDQDLFQATYERVGS